MKKVCIFSFGCTIFLISTFCSGQDLVNVDPLTGAANVTIPVYTVQNGTVSLPIGIHYAGNGIKVKDVEGTCGMSWNLVAGGQVIRELRGLPDDCSQDNSGATMLGWMSTSNSGATYAGSYTILNNGTTCSNGTTDVSNITANIPISDDTEPDIFDVNAPGLSCQMVYDRGSGSFQPVNYSDLKISFTTMGGTGTNPTQIVSFTIVNNQGISYVFAAPEFVTETTATTSGTPTYFTTQYNRYLNGIIYADSWSLVSISDPNGNSIVLTYGAAQPRIGVDPISLYIGQGTTQTFEYNVTKSVTPQILSTISTTSSNPPVVSQYFTFDWQYINATNQSYQTVLADINGMGRSMLFAYLQVNSPSEYQRRFLAAFTDQGCGSPISYQFQYKGVDFTEGTTTLPDSSSSRVDYWGYYSSAATSPNLQPSVYINPSNSSYPRYTIAASSSAGPDYQYSILPSFNRNVTPSSVDAGSLTSITNEHGGTTTITYEPNDYYDVPSSSVVQGGGIRVKQIVESTGSGATNDMTRNYSYVNPVGTSQPGLSSGEPVMLPQYAFTIPYSGSATGQSLWTVATALSAYDLSNDDETILYSNFSVSQTGAGSTLYNNYIPATYWNTSSGGACAGCSNTEWHPTVNYTSGSSCPPTTGPIANLTYSFPFLPNPNYDFERGLPLKVTSYNDAGTELSELDYTYVRSYTPTAINAFAYDHYGSSTLSAMSYGKYLVYYHTSELAATITKTVFDSNTLNRIPQISTTTYAYNSASHKLLTQQTLTNSDNSVVNTYFYYVKDFAPNAGATNANINALYNLQQLNINAPVETFQQVTRGASTLTTNASLTLFAPSTAAAVTNYLPSQQLKLVQPDGTSTFSRFSINTGAQTVSYNGNYIATKSFDQYDQDGFLLTAHDNQKHYGSTFFDHLTQHATAVFENAKYNEVAVNDFDSQYAPPLSLFNVVGTVTYVPGRVGNGAAIPASTQTVSTGVITKNAAAQNYIFSIWINSTAAGSLSFTGASPGISLNFNAAGWTYYEMKIPASSLGTTFQLGFTSSQSIYIDDVLLYPDVCETSTANYDPLGHYKIAETNTNGVSNYFTNDQWGRVQIAYDQDKNILLRNIYESAQNIQNFLTPVIVETDPGGNVYQGISAGFTNTAPNTCQTNLTYVWNFGDGSGDQPQTSDQMYHIYTSSGPFTVTVKVTSPLLGTKTGSLTINVVPLTSTTAHYNNTCQGQVIGGLQSYITVIDFMQGSTLVKHWVISQLYSTATTIIPPGAYTMIVHHIGPQYSYPSSVYGWNSIQYNGGAQCFGYQMRDVITITDDFSSSPDIYFTMSPAVCR